MPSQRPDLDFRPLTPELLDDFRVVQGRRAAVTQLAQLEPAPGLLAFEGNEPVGWVAIAPREQLIRVDRSRATPRVDDADVWVIPCVTVRKTERGRGIAVA